MIPEVYHMAGTILAGDFVCASASGHCVNINAQDFPCKERCRIMRDDQEENRGGTHAARKQPPDTAIGHIDAALELLWQMDSRHKHARAIHDRLAKCRELLLKQLVALTDMTRHL